MFYKYFEKYSISVIIIINKHNIIIYVDYKNSSTTSKLYFQHHNI